MPNGILMEVLKKILAPFASLYLTISLLAMAMLLVLAGTLAQVYKGVGQVQADYFHCLWTWVDFQLFWKKPSPGTAGIPGSFPMLGGYSIGLLLIINLIAAHAVRFKMKLQGILIALPLAGALLAMVLLWNRSVDSARIAAMVLVYGMLVTTLIVYAPRRVGIILTHLGLILLLLGEGITSGSAIEMQMHIEEGQTVNFAQDIRFCELAILDPSYASDLDEVIAIPQSRLTPGALIPRGHMPFDVKVVEFHHNTGLLGPAQARSVNITPKNTASDGPLQGAVLTERPRETGVGGSQVDQPGAVVRLSRDGKDLGQYIVTTLVDKPQPVRVGDSVYEIVLRFRRYYFPYSLTLKEFRFDRYPGTQIPLNFSSLVRLVDPTHRVHRDVPIRMNEPLRHDGQTFYQADWNHATEHGTVLQVVRNPGWLLPYASCIIVGVGLLVHFMMSLVTFADRHSKRIATATRANPPPLPQAGDSRRPADSRLPGGGLVSERPPRRDWRFAASGIALVLATMWIGYVVFRPGEKSEFDLHTFERLPVSHDGRVQPFKSVAVNTLKALSKRETATTADNQRIGATRWMLDVVARPDRAADYRCFAIDATELRSILGLDISLDRKAFSLREIMINGDRLQEQFEQTHDIPEKERDFYQRKLMELLDRIGIFMAAADPVVAREYPILPISDPELKQRLGLESPGVLADPAQAGLRKLYSVNDLTHDRAAFDKELDTANQTPPQQRARYQKLLLSAVAQAERAAPMGLRFIPPADGGNDWLNLADALHPGGPAPLDGVSPILLDAMRAYRSDSPDEFNTATRSFASAIEHARPRDAAHAKFEAGYQRLDPIGNSLYLYIATMLLALGSLLVWQKPLRSAALTLLVVALAIHTAGLIGRIHISGRPPVTNLPSSAIFIAWGAVVFAVIFELIFRNSIGALVGSFLGFVSLLIAGYLSLSGDNMKVLQAVLDTNYWLATHVVMVTLGYAATFFAGLLGILYLLLGLLNPRWTRDDAKNVSRMIYGTVCFALLFSFVGTVLGGIWADNSWGRFWGWDPKENGAVLIVLWNAIVLHTRWAGLIRERGVAIMVVFGNIVTSWSWFGTNMLGVGLHSYGFTDTGMVVLLISFCGSQLAIMGTGMVPLRHWLSQRQQ